MDVYPFALLQNAIDMQFVQRLSNKSLNVNITAQQLPYPPHRNNMYIVVVKKLFPYMTLFGFLLIFMNVLKRILEEKSSGIKELMKMMGLKSWMHWFGWFIYSMMVNIVTVTIVAILLWHGLSEKYPGIIVKGNPFILWLFLLLYCITTVCFAFFCSTLLSKPAIGTSVGICIWILSGFIGDRFVSDDPNTLPTMRYIFSFVPNVLLRLGFAAITEFEKRGGIGFSVLWVKPSKYLSNPPMGCVLLTLIFDSFLFCILTWYLENVFPGEYGIARPWYFPFTKSYWMNNKVVDYDSYASPLIQKPGIERVPNEMTPGVQIRNLTKQFEDKEVVDDLSFDIYQNEITVLLGHNGAGKTTTMNMITGLTSPTEGTVIVNGKNIYKNLDAIRKSLGLCPQFNVQFTDLTLREHLMFFAMLKSSSRKDAKIESRNLLQKLGLLSKENVMAGKLSGGMRRKLSLAMAVVGHSSVLILDEPTSGLDPEARREIWDFLMAMRGRRTILITTHYMEEADVLGDRIAIMHSGRLQCYGSSLFLKKYYGTGYVLSLLVKSEWDVEKIINTVKSYVPMASIKSSTGNSLTISLPTNDTSALSSLFLHLDKNKSNLNISNFGVSITTMEEVFLKVGEIADELDKGADEESRRLLDDDLSVNSSDSYIERPIFLMQHQLVGLLIKRFKYTKHKWIIFLLQILLPLGLILLAFVIMKIQDTKHDPQTDLKFNMRLENYPKSQIFYSNSGDEIRNLSTIYADFVRSEGAIAKNVFNVSKSAIEIGKQNMDDYDHSLVAAAELKKSSNIYHLNAMYGSFALNGLPISLNLLSNALLKLVTRNSTASYGISTTTHPMPDADDVTASNMFISLERAINWMFIIPLAMTILIAIAIIFPQQERATGNNNQVY